MKYLKYKAILIFFCRAIISSGQCSFQYISNDTVFQDYIEFIYSKKNVDEIITIGSRINRGIINDSIYNAPVFQIFDYCGNILNKIVYKYIGSFKLRHVPIPTHNTYKEEPIGNTAININDDEFLIVDKAIDTLLKKSVMILLKVTGKGEVTTYKTLPLDIQEANSYTIKNVLKLKDGKLLIVLWDYAEGYFFYYFDTNSDFLYKKSFTLARGIRSMKEIDNGEFVCTSLTDVKASFQFYRFDTSGSGEIKWLVTPYNTFGSAREIKIENNKIYVIGGTEEFGAFLICDLDGTILKEFKYDTFYCKPRFCSTYLDLDNSFVIGGYIQHCLSTDSSGADVALVKIDTSGKILQSKLYDFRNELGTSDSHGYYNDYGGFAIAKANDGGMITNGMSRHSKLSLGGVLHEDALLIKAKPLFLTNTNKQINLKGLNFYLLGSMVNNNLNVTGPVNLIMNWAVYSLQGEALFKGKDWLGSINVGNIEQGVYFIQIVDRNNYQYFLRFVKI